MFGATEIRLPVGRWTGAARERRAVVRALDGADEALAAALAETLDAEALLTALLARCTVALGDAKDPGTEAIGELVLGDRAALALHVRRLTFGERLPCVVRCPACGEPMDVDLTVADLLGEEQPDLPNAWDERVAGRRMRFRLPTGADLEAAARAGRAGTDAALRALVGACVLSPAAPGDAAVDGVGERLRELDPLAETTLQLSCPTCEQDGSVAFDPGAHLLREAALDASALIEDVHRLALAYGWREPDVLALPVPRRRRYLDLVDVVLTGEELA